MRVSCYVALAVIAVMAAGAVPAEGQLIVSDSFDYADAKQLTGKAGGEGWQGTWQSHGDGSVEVVEGLSFEGVASAGSAVQVLQPERSEQRLARAIADGAAVPAGATVWVSYLFRAQAEGSQHAVHEVRISENADDVYDSGPEDDPATEDVDEGDNWYRRLRTHATMYAGEPLDPAVDVHDDKRTDGDDPIATGQTYLIVGRYTNVNNPAAEVEGTVWAIAEPDFAKIAGGKITAARLDKAASVKATETEDYDAQLGPGDFVQLVGFQNVAEVPVEQPAVDEAAEEAAAATEAESAAGTEAEQPVETTPVPIGTFDELRIGVGAQPSEAGVLPSGAAVERAAAAAGEGG